MRTSRTLATKAEHPSPPAVKHRSLLSAEAWPILRRRAFNLQIRDMVQPGAAAAKTLLEPIPLPTLEGTSPPPAQFTLRSPLSPRSKTTTPLSPPLFMHVSIYLPNACAGYASLNPSPPKRLSHVVTVPSPRWRNLKFYARVPSRRQ